MTQINKTMNKQELAFQYKVTTKTLMSWISRNNELTGELNQTGYRKTNKLFTPKQLTLIVKFLGEF